MLEDPLNEFMTSLEVVGRLHQNEWRCVEARESFLELWIVRHDEEFSTLVIEMPCIVFVRCLLGLCIRAAFCDASVEPAVEEIVSTIR